LSKTRRLFFFHRSLPQQNFKTLKTLSLSLKRTELVGTRGIEPLRTIIEQRRVPGDLLESFSGTPTLIWLLDALGVEAGAAADCLSLLGALLAGAAFAGYLGGCAPLFVALSLLYLALIAPLASATTRGSSLPWAELPSDGLLLEAAFAAALWAPLWPKSKEEKDEEDDEREEVGGGNEEAASSSSSPSSLSAPALAPAFLLRWIVAKNAFFRGLCRWKRSSAAAAAAVAVLSSSSSSSAPNSPLSLVALVADVALAPMALSPARLPRLVAATALLVSSAIDGVLAFQFSSPSSASQAAAAPPLWTLILRPVLVLPLLHAGLLDTSGSDKRSSSSPEKTGGGKIKLAARFFVSAGAFVPALFSALGVLSPRSFPSSSSFETSLSSYAPYCLAAAGLTMLASLSADVLRSMASASIVGLLEEEEETGQEKTKKLSAPPPMTLSMRRRQAQEQKQEEKDERKLGKRGGRTRDPQKVEYVRGAHEPALVGAISLLLFCAGCLEVFTSAASPAAAAADRGCSGGPGCGGGPAALVVARRLSWLARPWRATGPSFGSLMREEEGRVGSSAAPPVAVEVRSDCRDDDDDGSGGVWTRISPRSRSSRVAAALSSLSHAQEFRHADGVNESQWGGGEENGGGSSSSSSSPPPPPPWLDHLLYRLVSDPTGPVAASFAPPAWQQRQQQPAPAPCAARAVVGGGGGTLASFSAAEAADASSPAAESLARHGWGPLVEYEGPSGVGRAVADAVALPRTLFGGCGKGKVGGGKGGGFNVVLAGAGAAGSIALSAAALAAVRRGRGESPEAAAAAASSKKRE